MALEQDITDLVQATDRLTGLVDGKIEQIDSRVDLAQAQVNDYVTNARGETPFYRLSKNQILSGTSGSVPDFWSSGSAVTYTLVQSVNHAVDWADRTAEEQALLNAMQREQTRYLYANFNIWRMDWTQTDHEYTMYQHINASIPTTVAAMTKLLSGSINTFWATGATNEWKLTGDHYGLPAHRYHHIHPIRQSTTGSMLFALPAAVAGHVPLDAKLWGTFPYIGDTQNG